jgi:predicted regulator of Ras-like GTPase activity (Roadblock/LC7/MglB family)
MKLPAGTDGGTITNPEDEGFIHELMVFRGAIEIKTTAGNGFILVDKGKMVAAYFRAGKDTFHGKTALAYMTLDSGDADTAKKFRLRKYNDAEFDSALTICRETGLLVGQETQEPEIKEPEKAPEPPAVTPPNLLDRSKLKKILSQPGVIAVSAFFEGFPVQSIGDADFEHVAASAEDFMRAGTKIAEEMNIGHLDQMILETADNKFIVAPCGDLFLCVFTTADAQLGLIRVVLKSIQAEVCQ